MVNGLVIYLALKEEGQITTNPDDPGIRDLIKRNVFRDRADRLSPSGADDGYMEAVVIARIQAVLRQLRDA